MSKQSDAVSFHRRIIKRALGVAWHHKHLWIFGFFAAFSGFGGAYEALFRIYDRTAGELAVTGGYAGLGLMPGTATMLALIRTSSSPWLAASIYSVVALLLLAVFVWVMIMALGATISGVKAIAKGQDLNFAEALKKASQHFWKILALILGMKLLTWLSSLVISANLFQLTGAGGPFKGLLFLLSFALFAALSVVIAMVGIYAVTAVVDEDSPLRAAVRKAWKVFKDNWLVSLEAGLLVLLVQITVMILAIGALLVLSVPFIFLMLLALMFNLPSMGVAIAVVATIAVVLVLCLLAAYLTVFQVAVWWQLWQEFGGKGLLAGLERLYHRAKQALKK